MRVLVQHELALDIGQTSWLQLSEHRHKGHPHPALRATFSRKREKGKLLAADV
jgi:hypothetical protein